METFCRKREARWRACDPDVRVHGAPGAGERGAQRIPGPRRPWSAHTGGLSSAIPRGIRVPIGPMYRKRRYAESALYLWKRGREKTDARTALQDSMSAPPDTSLARERMEELLPTTGSVS